MNKLTEREVEEKKYEIRSFDDFMDVLTEENVDIVFGNFYAMVKQFLKTKHKYPELTLVGFNWIDDGKIEVKGVSLIEIQNVLSQQTQGKEEKEVRWVYESQSGFKLGDKVKCLFGDSGHKFWDELKSQLTITGIAHETKARPDKLIFEGITGSFYENDFQLLQSPSQVKEVEESITLNQIVK